MRGLKDWNKLLKKYNLAALLCIGSLNILSANEQYLSEPKENILNYSYKKAVEDSTKLKNDWINPITYKYSYLNTQTYDTTKSYISISQPIFKSGGIYYAIKYAKSVENQTNNSIDVQKKELIKQVISILYEIKKSDVTLSKQALLIQNAKLDVQRKKEQVLNGILDTSFLDNAILDLNSKHNSFIDLEYQRDTFVNTLSQLSDKKYDELELPIFSLIIDDTFIKNNIYIKQVQDEIDTSYWVKNMVKSNYLPTVNLTADYTRYHNTDNNTALDESSHTYGFNITIPLDIKYSNTIESAKIEYLQNKASLEDKKREETVIFKNTQAKLKSLDKKIAIAKSDITLYDSLVTQIQEQLEVGMKTQSDLETIQNSQKIKILEIQSLKVEKQMELLELYSRMES